MLQSDWGVDNGARTHDSKVSADLEAVLLAIVRGELDSYSTTNPFPTLPKGKKKEYRNIRQPRKVKRMRRKGGVGQKDKDVENDSDEKEGKKVEEDREEGRKKKKS
ncbi:hypothetical protein PoB_001926700 [Plakobranchus ocellatus]|uniref:Uncharacterized protein n=1 Tax=Plakobranchus ocellatus TaxID=259542 RepID=A0AAV3ZBX3_9GAST|nr:hypothetical protein PoB_001926700 [Plakobranchus ocellatus]